VLLYDDSLLGTSQNVLCADAGRGEVLAFRTIPHGAGFVLEPAPSVVRVGADRARDSAHWFRPSDLAVSGDGALLVADWYDPGVGDHVVGDLEGHGRVLRVAPRGYRVPPPPRGVRDCFVVREEDDKDKVRAELGALRNKSLEASKDELVRLARGYDGADPIYLEAFGLACEGKEDELYPLLEEELGDVPSQWDPRFAGLAWRLHPPRALGAFVARAKDTSLAHDARKQALDAIAFMKTKEAAAAMANLAVASPEDLRSYARWWFENRATNDWSAWVDR
jgi:hypothetical protein